MVGMGPTAEGGGGGGGGAAADGGGGAAAAGASAFGASAAFGVPAKCGSETRNRELGLTTVCESSLQNIVSDFFFLFLAEMRHLKPPFRSLKSGVPPSTFPPSGTKSSSITPEAGDGTCTEV